MSRRSPLSHRRAAELGWTRTDPRPWSKCSAVWTHRSGWQLRHAGHATALRPWLLVAPAPDAHGVEQSGGAYSDPLEPMRLVYRIARTAPVLAELEPARVVAVHRVAGLELEVRIDAAPFAIGGAA